MISAGLKNEATDDSLAHMLNSALARASGFERKPTLAVAVSGGADSMALLALTCTWAQARGGKVVALTVNHGLRAQAAAEAEYVERYAKSMGAQHHTITLSLANTTANIQRQARELRYAALEKCCAERGILHLLTAHHADDNAETITMRMQRQVSLDAQLGIPFIRYTNNLRIIRPLLRAQKEQLVDWLTSQHIQWMEDASNQSDKYERNRVRKNLAESPVNMSEMQTHIHLAAMQKLELENQYAESAALCIRAYEGGYLTLDTHLFIALPKEVQINIINQLCYAMGKENTAPRGHELIKLVDQLANKSPAACCLAGLQFTPNKKGGWIITRELAHAQTPIALKSNARYEWDGRFTIDCQHLPNADYTLGTLGEAGALELKKMTTLPRQAFLSLPAIWHLDQLAYVPHINKQIIPGLSQQIQVKQRMRQPLFGSAHRYDV